MSDSNKDVQKFLCHICGKGDEEVDLRLTECPNFPWTRRCDSTIERNLQTAGRNHASRCSHDVAWYFKELQKCIPNALDSKVKESLDVNIAKFVLFKSGRRLNFEEFERRCEAPVKVQALLVYASSFFEGAKNQLKDSKVRKAIENAIRIAKYNATLKDIIKDVVKVIESYSHIMSGAIVDNENDILVTPRRELFCQLQDVWSGHRFDHDSLVYRASPARACGSPYKVGPVHINFFNAHEI